MIVLDTTHTLKIVLEETATTQLDFYASYIDTANDEVGSNEGTTNDTTDVTLVNSPSSGKRLIRFVNIYNADDTSHNVVIKIDDGTNQRVLKRVTLTSKDSLVYTPSKGWIIESLKKFIQLDDTPNSYSGLAGKLFKVNSAETALEASTNTDSEISDAVNKKHSQNTDHKITDADGDSGWDTEETADKDEIVGKVAGVEALRIYSSGILDFSKQSACSVYLSTNQNITATTETKLQLDTEDYDIQNEFDSSTNYRWTATKDGKYLIRPSALFQVAADQDYCSLYIYKNGTAVRRKIMNASGTNNMVISEVTVLDLSANDYIEVFVENDSHDDTIQAGSLYTRLEIIKLN